MHVLAARCDLETGRSLNIAPPGWEKTFGPLRDAFKHEHGWSRPDDPARARVQQPGHRAYVEAARLRTALEEQLTRALRRLSAQYEREQRRQSGQVEAVRRPVGKAGRTKPCSCESSGSTGK